MNELHKKCGKIEYVFIKSTHTVYYTIAYMSESNSRVKKWYSIPFVWILHIPVVDCNCKANLGIPFWQVVKEIHCGRLSSKIDPQS